MINERSSVEEKSAAVRFFYVAILARSRGGATLLGIGLGLPILTRLACLPNLLYRSFFNNPVKPFEDDNRNSIFDKYGGKVVKIFEKSVFLVVKFDNFG